MKNLQFSDYGLSARRIGLVMAVSLLAAVFEGFGMTMFLPVLEFIEGGQDAAALAQSSRYWDWIISAVEASGLEMSLALLLGAALAVMLLRVVFVYLRQVYLTWVGQEILHVTRTTLFREFVRSDYALFDSLSTGHVVNSATVETMRLGGYFASLFAMVSNGLVICGFLGVLLWLSWSMTLVAAALLLVGGLCVAYYVRHTREVSRRTTASNMDFSFLIIERLTAMRLIKLAGVGRRESDRLGRASGSIRDNMFTLGRYNASIDLVLEPFVLVTGVVLIYCSVNVFHMSLAQVGLFMVVLLRLMPLSKELLRSRQSFLASSGSMQAVSGSLAQARAAREAVGGDARFSALEESVAFKGVTFTYPGQDAPAIKGLELSLPARKTTAIVGPSGAGKSTLADLLPLLRRPQHGQILFDGVPTGDFVLESLRARIAFVSQDAAILNDTVRANIGFAVDGATEDEIVTALDKARALDFVHSLPEGLDTVLGEKGMRLSGGQRQRLSLARALLRKVPLLILDEPTSALDSEVERDIQDALAQLREEGETTVVIIAHRLSTIRDADKIVVLMDGEVAAEGTHEELLESGNWYALVTKLQEGGGLVDEEGNGNHLDKQESRQ